MKDHLEYVGRVVGDYRLLRWLGGGGFGNVYLAEDMRSSVQVAVKVLQIHLTKQEDWRSFINEARTMRLRHPHIVPLLDFGLDRHDTPFLVMEYAPQGTLRDRHPIGTRVPLAIAIKYASQMASALQYAHEAHLVHRDVKPENMLVRSDGTILLSDFGIATTVHTTHSRTNKGMLGTVPYVSPEQASGKPRAASDQYSLAIVLYEWISGRVPFEGAALDVAIQHATQLPPSLIAQVPDISSEVEDVLFKALAKDYKDRFPSTQAFLVTLQRAHTSAPFRSSAVIRAAKPTFKDVAPPPVKVQPSMNVALTAPRPVLQPEKTQSETAQVSCSSLDTRSQKLSAIPSPANSAFLSAVRKYSFSKTWRVLLVLLCGLVIVGGSYTYVTVKNIQRKAVAKEASNAYSSAVAQHGTMFGFDAAHTHTNSYERILDSDNVSQLQQVWRANVSMQHSDYSPAVARGVLYIGSLDGNLYALDAISGKEIWVASVNAGLASSPAIVNGTVYVGSLDGNLYAFDASTGKKDWIAPSGGIIYSSPTVANGIVYVGSWDNKLYAFDAITGEQKWVAPTAAHTEASPAVADGVVYLGSLDNKLYAFDAITGKQKWTATTGGDIDSSPAIANGIVYVGSWDNKLYAFDAMTGEQKWAASTGSIIYSSPAIDNGVVYIGSSDYKLYAFDARTGKQKWAVATNGGIDSSPLVANGVVYTGSLDHKLYAFDAITGDQKWTATTGDSINSSPIVANGMVYVGSRDDKLYAFSLPE
ncbi:beta-alanine-activating enzyme beta-propeller domain-containing protein [Dictyobacter vulcani]|nr:serine/threonine-protein kinase [Dictyobacter vulcani]